MKGKRSLMTACVIYLILGAILLLFPGLTAGLFCTAVGLLLLLYGGVTIVSFFLHRGSSRSFGFQAELILGIISAVLGLVFLCKPAVILSILPLILGLYIFIDGLVNLKRGLDLKAFGYPGWKTTVIFSVVSLCLGGLVLWNPFATQLLLIRVVGGAFLYQGISDLIAVIALGKFTKNM